ncbi:hypothetical protein [Catellatospora vulcania]|uniref:hypothetical protein n=1 Tax=Catellatospora vulcania TaxID=1460450 RepID=UPI0012D3ACBB|nr:hypothetical protein [Catellatospora vulcania]
MEIIPGVGVEPAKIGDRREAVEQRLGPPVHQDLSRHAVYASDPMLSVTYDLDGIVELVDAAYSGHHGGEELFLRGVQLTYRFMDDVVADLAAMGLIGVPYDIGVDYEADGFAVYSNSSLSAQELDPDADVNDERRIVEGVSIAPRANLER